MRTKIKHRLEVVLCLFGVLLWIVAGCLQMFASAADVNGSLTMICETTDGELLPGTHWELFRVGGRDADGEYELQDDFAKYPVSLEDTSATALLEAAETLETYAKLDKIEPYAQGDADANGYLKLSPLETGLYVVSGDMARIGDVYYFFSAFLIEISDADGGEIHWTAYPKCISMNAEEGGFEYTLKKIWANDQNEPENRSAYITAEIYRDDVLFETVRLDESNDWTYTWKADSVHEWRVIEVDIPEGYDVVYRSNETQYVIVNTFTDSSSITDSTEYTDSNMTETNISTETNVTETLPEKPDSTETQVTQTSAVASTTVTTVATQTTTQPEKLPQTGQLWWPVPLLALAGLFSIVVGVQLRTKE